MQAIPFLCYFNKWFHQCLFVRIKTFVYHHMYLKIKYFDYLNRSCIFFLCFLFYFLKFRLEDCWKKERNQRWCWLIDDNVSNINECEKTVLENWDCQKQCKDDIWTVAGAWYDIVIIFCLLYFYFADDIIIFITAK